MAPPRQNAADDGDADYDREEEDYLDDDDSGDDFRSAPALPRLGARGQGALATRNSLRSSAAGAASTSKAAKDGGAPGKPKPKSKAKDAGYSWEATYKRSWDNVHEDESGSLESAVRQMIESNKRKRITRDVAPVQRGIIRHLVLLIDLSSSMLEKDLRPNRFDLTLQYAREFVQEYFDQNPIGQLSVIATRNGIAERVAMMGGNTVDHVASLGQRRRLEPSGEPSLQNALEMARSSLAHLPASNSREILAIFGSLTTCDPGNIHDTIRQLQRDHIRVSMVSLAAEVKIYRDVCTKTGGTFSVALNEGHFRDCLFDLVPPPAVEGPGRGRGRGPEGSDGDGDAASQGIDLLQMAFPLRLPAHSDPTLCACHSKVKGAGYLCPRCGCKVCDVPTDCPVCGITIVMSTHLARSYHHLFPVGNWLAVPWEAVTPASNPNCFSCNLPFPPKPDPAQAPTHANGHANASASASASANANGSTATSSSSQAAATVAAKAKAPNGARAVVGAVDESGLAPSSRYACSRCRTHFCLECDAFVHEQLHVCPGCC
ncbi:uncharacterized protein PFL1_05421 [Pseudozyma flocculosa PF-1]|uniref:VWFA domain-containing protein n=2 Tax=Pseudozyma flocculosa TaxID=84751 RepID=A0A061H579_9BASI|nr:uncharacterized protein PFL1_05421 [Pseudozyma flocculosa PF-1]EPQ27140.1 hypothetical protein PFL1_05421 [Pseudozyma flocculosa PF-1]SPO41282.1 probable SSL1 - TFIIH subunit (transcription initiation factor), factor B [Pseudozyma flocculosa]